MGQTRGMQAALAARKTSAESSIISIPLSWQ